MRSASAAPAPRPEQTVVPFRKAKGRRTEEIAFLPAALEIAEAPPSPIGRAIAIARALVTNPRILIFDEATSALDYESERIIHENMKEIARGRTVLIIAHRLSTVRNADRIFTLERGRLVEDGTHEALIKTGGRYAALHRLQGGLHEVG